MACCGFDVVAPPPKGVSARSPVVIAVTPYAEDGSSQDCFVTYSPDDPTGAPQPLHLQDRDSRLLFLAEFLESGIGAQSVPDRIKPQKRWRNNHWRRQEVIIIGRLQQPC
jgi:hypothetical protein